MKNTIKIGGTAYPIKYGYRAIKGLAKQWGIDNMLEVYNVLIQMIPTENPETVDVEKLEMTAEIQNQFLSFENIDKIVDITLAGLDGGLENTEMPDNFTDEIVAALFETPANLETVFKTFFESMPGAKLSPQPAQKKRKKAKAKTE
jgi:hypothetical protein